MENEAIATGARVVLNQPGVGRLVIRLFDGQHDSLHAIRALQRQASLAIIGTVTGQRSGASTPSALPEHASGEMFVATCDSRMVGTMTIEPQSASTACEHYRRNRVAMVRDLAVEASMRHHGIAQVMLAYGCRQAAAKGYTQLAVEVPCANDEMMNYSRFLGFTLVEVIASEAGGDRAIFSCPTIVGWPAFYATSRMALWAQDPS